MAAPPVVYVTSNADGHKGTFNLMMPNNEDPASLTGREMKSKIRQTAGIPEEAQLLRHQGRVIEDWETGYQHGLRPGGTIALDMMQTGQHNQFVRPPAVEQSRQPPVRATQMHGGGPQNGMYNNNPNHHHGNAPPRSNSMQGNGHMNGGQMNQGGHMNGQNGMMNNGMGQGGGHQQMNGYNNMGGGGHNHNHQPQGGNPQMGQGGMPMGGQSQQGHMGNNQMQPTNNNGMRQSQSQMNVQQMGSMGNPQNMAGNGNMNGGGMNGNPGNGHHHGNGMHNNMGGMHVGGSNTGGGMAPNNMNMSGNMNSNMNNTMNGTMNATMNGTMNGNMNGNMPGNVPMNMVSGNPTPNVNNMPAVQATSSMGGNVVPAQMQSVGNNSNSNQYSTSSSGAMNNWGTVPIDLSSGQPMANGAPQSNMNGPGGPGGSGGGGVGVPMQQMPINPQVPMNPQAPMNPQQAPMNNTQQMNHPNQHGHQQGGGGHPQMGMQGNMQQMNVPQGGGISHSHSNMNMSTMNGNGMQMGANGNSQVMHQQQQPHTGTMLQQQGLPNAGTFPSPSLDSLGTNGTLGTPASPHVSHHPQGQHHHHSQANNGHAAQMQGTQPYQSIPGTPAGASATTGTVATTMPHQNVQVPMSPGVPSPVPSPSATPTSMQHGQSHNTPQHNSHSHHRSQTHPAQSMAQPPPAAMATTNAGPMTPPRQHTQQTTQQSPGQSPHHTSQPHQTTRSPAHQHTNRQTTQQPSEPRHKESRHSSSRHATQAQTSPTQHTRSSTAHQSSQQQQQQQAHHHSSQSHSKSAAHREHERHERDREDIDFLFPGMTEVREGLVDYPAIKLQKEHHKKLKHEHEAIRQARDMEYLKSHKELEDLKMKSEIDVAKLERVIKEKVDDIDRLSRKQSRAAASINRLKHERVIEKKAEDQASKELDQKLALLDDASERARQSELESIRRRLREQTDFQNMLTAEKMRIESERREKRAMSVEAENALARRVEELRQREFMLEKEWSDIENRRKNIEKKPEELLSELTNSNLLQRKISPKSKRHYHNSSHAEMSPYSMGSREHEEEGRVRFHRYDGKENSSHASLRSATGSPDTVDFVSPDGRRASSHSRDTPLTNMSLEGSSLMPSSKKRHPYSQQHRHSHGHQYHHHGRQPPRHSSSLHPRDLDSSPDILYDEGSPRSLDMLRGSS